MNIVHPSMRWSGTTSYKPTATNYKQSSRWLAACGLRLAAAASGFVLTLQTVWILRPGSLDGIPWPLATIGVFPGDIVLIIGAMIGVRQLLRQSTDEHIPYTAVHGICHPQWSSARAMILVVAIVSVAIVNIAISADPWLSAVGWARIIAFLLALAGLPLWSASARRAFLSGFLLAMLGHVVLGFLQFATGHGFASTIFGTATHDAFVRGDAVVETVSGRWLRAYGGFPHPNVFGTALLVALIAIISFLRRHPSAAGATSGRRSVSLLTSYFLLLPFSLVLSFSRAAWLGFVVLLVVMVRRRFVSGKHSGKTQEQPGDGRKTPPELCVPNTQYGRAQHLAHSHPTRSLAAVGAVAFVAFVLALWPLVVPRFSGTTSNEARSVSERRTGITDALALMRSHPLLGVGLHAMPRALADRAAQSPSKTLSNKGTGTTLNPPLSTLHSVNPYSFQPAHNVPLLAIAEIGPIGAFVLVFVLVRLFRSQRPHALRLTPYGAMWFALVPSLLFDHHLWSLPIGLALVFVLVVRPRS